MVLNHADMLSHMMCLEVKWNETKKNRQFQLNLMLIFEFSYRFHSKCIRIEEVISHWSLKMILKIFEKKCHFFHSFSTFEYFALIFFFFSYFSYVYVLNSHKLKSALTFLPHTAIRIAYIHQRVQRYLNLWLYYSAFVIDGYAELNTIHSIELIYEHSE